MDAGIRRGISLEQRFEKPIFEGERQILQAADIYNHSVKSLYGRIGEDRRDRRGVCVKPNEIEIARKPPDVLREEGQWDARSRELRPVMPSIDLR
jgi:hypothetical protein